MGEILVAMKQMPVDYDEFQELHYMNWYDRRKFK